MRPDETFLLAMLIAARKVSKFAEGLTEDTFRDSELHQSAIIRELGVIAEAARQITDNFKAAHPEISWKQISAMRNRLIHEYFAVSLAIVWQTAQEDIQPLIEQLEPLIPPEEEEE
jgi:uncharacterized protein with HEPN domain